MIKIIITVAVMFFLGCNCCERKQDEILSVVALFRHGDKTPKAEYFNIYPNNPWNNPKLWNYSDPGSVTNRGKLKIYDVGKWLRRRYGTFLPDKYSNKHVFVRASDSDRVLVSAQLVLAGLFPPKGTDVWNAKLEWQPIPIHTRPDAEDMVIAQKAPCPKFDKLFKKELEKERLDWDELKRFSQFTGHELQSLEQAYKLYKLLRVVEENGMALPSWSPSALPLLKAKSDLLCRLYALTPEMQRLKAGPFLHAVLAHFDGIASKSPNAPKMLLFAGHSRTITNVLMTLRSYSEQPPYSATLIFELKRNCNGSLVIDIYYLTSIHSAPFEVVKNVSYEYFRETMKPFAVDPDTWRKECRKGFFF